MFINLHNSNVGTSLEMPHVTRGAGMLCLDKLPSTVVACTIFFQYYFLTHNMTFEKGGLINFIFSGSAPLRHPTGWYPDVDGCVQNNRACIKHADRVQCC